MKFKDYVVVSSIEEIPNNNLLTEAGLSRIIAKIKEKDFAIITAYRDIYTKAENIKRNRQLRSHFNDNKMGVYQLVGHWRECQLDGVEYKDCPKDKLIDAIERSYLVIRPDSMDFEKFKNMIKKLTSMYNQDGSVISNNGDIYIVEKNGNYFKIGSSVTLNKISQAYIQYVKKMNVPFVFEAEVPSTNISKQIFKHENILYPKVIIGEKVHTWDSIDIV